MRSTNRPESAAPDGFDVFLSHNGADKDAVLEIAGRLRDVGIAPFLDIWHLVPGEPWQEALEDALERSRACAVFLGPAGFGPWENEEMRVALSRRVKDSEYRVIPVLLPGAELPNRGKLPGFLSRVTWADFRPGLDDAAAFDRLVSGIRGLAPETGSDSSEAASPDAIVCPFRGLEVFDEAHAEFFFGREALTQHLIEQLRADRFLAVLGPSGSGKSSVVRAGLIPALRNGALPGSAGWEVLIVRPGPNPMEALATRLVEHTGARGDAVGTQASILEALARDERGLHTIAQLAADGHSSDDRVVLLVDQFEEIFTLVDDEAERRRFVAALLYASSVAGGPTVVVTTMRADFFGKCAAIPGLAARLSERDVLVAPMGETELRDAMIRPAEMVGLQFEKGLVDTILEDLGDEPGSLPLLQHTLLELFDGRRGRWLTIDRYRAIGGVKGAIASRAENVYDHLTPEQQVTARRILLRLTQPGEGTEDTRRRAAVSELVPSGTAGSATEAVVNQLAEARLVTTSRNEAGDEVVDVAHEALIRGWPRLQRWVDENPAALRIHRDLTIAAEAWNANKREKSYLYSGPRLDEAAAFAARNPDDLNDLERTFLKASRRARQSRTIRLVGGLAAASLVVAALGVVAFIQGQQAQRAAGEATANALMSDSVALAPESPALGLRLAAEALVRGDELGMDLKKLTTNASAQIAAGRYAHLPRPIGQSWTDPQGRILIGGRHEEAPSVFDVKDGSVIGQLDEPLDAAEFSLDPDAGVFVAAYQGGEYDLRRIDNGTLIESPEKMTSVAFDPNPGVKIVVVGYNVDLTQESNPPAEVRSIVDGRVLRTLAGSGHVISVASAAGSLALVTYSSGGIEVVRMSDGSTVTTMESGPGSLVIPTLDGRSFVVAENGGCTLWSIELQVSVDLGNPCPTVQPSLFGGTLIVVGDADVRVIDLATGQSRPRIEGQWRLVTYSRGSPAEFLVLGNDTETRVYRTRDGVAVAAFPYPITLDEERGSAEFSPDSSLVFLRLSGWRVLLSTATGDVVLSTKFTGSQAETLAASLFGFLGVSFSSDGAWMLTKFANHQELRHVDAPETPGAEVDANGSFWPGSDGALIVGDSGLQRARPDGNVEQLLSLDQVGMDVVGYQPVDEQGAALVTFVPLGKPPPPPAILTPDGVLHELGRDVIGTMEFSGDAQNSFVLVRPGASQMSLWDRADKPNLLATLDGEQVTSWDPNARWLATSTATGDAYLVDVAWLVSMAGSVPSRDVQWLEDQVCNGPARKLVDDAALADRLGDAPHSCRAH